MRKHDRNRKSIAAGICSTFLTAVLGTVSICLGGCGAQHEDTMQYMKIGVVVYNQDDTYLGEMISEFKDDIRELQSEDRNITVTVRYGAGVQRTEDDRVEELLDAGCDVLCVNLVDRTMPSNIISMAEAKKVPVIFFNREPVREDLMQSENLYYIGCDARESGIMQGELAAEAIASDSSIDRNRDGKIQYVLLQGEPGHQDAIVRTENSVNTLLESGVELEKLSYQIANWNRAQAQAKMSQLISQFGSRIELVLCNNDDMALGAIDAYDRANITESDRPAVFGTDGTKVGLQAILDGTMRGTVYNDKEGQALMMAKLAVALYDGSDLSLFPFQDGVYIYLPYQKLTADNVVEFLEK